MTAPNGSAAPPFWRPERHALRRPALLARSRLAASLRTWFAGEGFLEVDTPVLQISPGNEAHLHAFRTQLERPSGEAVELYLHTSPEFACKKLLAAGESRIFTFARVFRNRERGPLHHPEFTLLEWYRAGEGSEALMADCARMLRLAAEAGGRDRFSFRGRDMDPHAEPERLSVAEAFTRHAGIDLLESVDERGGGRVEVLRRLAAESGVRTAEDDVWADVFSRILVERVEPRLGIGRATLLTDYPACEAALARRRADDPRLSERFELYACGVELANAFGELTDPVEQRRRLETEMDEKARVYGERYPIDEDFLAALAAMPPASGAALGFDRLVLLAAGARDLEEVVWAPPPG